MRASAIGPHFYPFVSGSWRASDLKVLVASPGFAPGPPVSETGALLIMQRGRQIKAHREISGGQRQQANAGQSEMHEKRRDRKAGDCGTPQESSTA